MTTPLPAARPSALMTIGYRGVIQNAISLGWCRALGKGSGRDIVVLEELLRKTLAGFQTCLIGGRSDNSHPIPAKSVDDALAQRDLRPDESQIHILLLRETLQPCNIVRMDSNQFGLFANAAVAGRREHFGYFWTLHKRIDYRVLAAAGADNKNFHLMAVILVRTSFRAPVR